MKLIEINNLRNLSEIFSILHDAQVDTDRISFDNGLLTIEAKRLDTSADKIILRSWILFKSMWVPMVLCKLELDNVKNYELIDDQGIGTYTLNTYVLEWPHLIIEFSEVSKLRITFSGDLRGRFFDVKLLDEYDKNWIVPPWWRLAKKLW